MKNAYVTKRIAPYGYVAVTKPLAQLLYNEGYAVTICGSNVNSYHVFKGWRLGATVDNVKDKDYTFDTIISNYEMYNVGGLSKHVVFYVRCEVVNNMDLALLKEKV